MSLGHFRRTVNSASITAGAQTLLMIVAQKDEARLSVLGQDHRAAARGVGDVTRLPVEIPVVNWPISETPIGSSPSPLSLVAGNLPSCRAECV